MIGYLAPFDTSELQASIDASTNSLSTLTTSLKNPPSFLVYYSGLDSDVSFDNGSVVIFNTKAKDTHNAYDTTTGYFTAPEAGTYLFIFNYYSNKVDTDDNKKYRPSIIITGPDSIASVQMNTMSPGSISCIAKMNKGDTACVKPINANYNIGFYGAKNHSSFSGTLLSYS